MALTRSNGITEGLHNKMETMARQAYGFLAYSLVWNGGPVATRTPDLYRVKVGVQTKYFF